MTGLGLGFAAGLAAFPALSVGAGENVAFPGNSRWRRAAEENDPASTVVAVDASIRGQAPLNRALAAPAATNAASASEARGAANSLPAGETRTGRLVNQVETGGNSHPYTLALPSPRRSGLDGEAIQPPFPPERSAASRAMVAPAPAPVPDSSAASGESASAAAVTKATVRIGPAAPAAPPPPPAAPPPVQAAIRTPEIDEIVPAYYRAQVEESLTPAREELVNHALLRRALERRGLKVAPEEVAAAMREKVAGWQSGPIGREGLDALVRRRAGMSAAAYEWRVVWPEIALRRLVAASPGPAEATLEDFFAIHPQWFAEPEAVRLSQIVISPLPPAAGDSVAGRIAGTDDWERAKRLAGETVDALRSGADFGQIAGRRSHDPRAAAKGGALGWVARGEILRELEEAAFGLAPGGVSDPVRTPLGFHILQVAERRPARMPAFASVKEKVRAVWEKHTFMARAVDMMERLRAEAAAAGDLPRAPF